MAEFRPLPAIAAALVERQAIRCGRDAPRLLRWMRQHGGVRTLPEIWEHLGVPIPEIEQTLILMEGAGLLCRREMITESGDVPCWWAPGIPGHIAIKLEGRA
jgi:hypothetical protein